MFSQVYILNSDDEVKSDFVNSANKSALVNGGLFNDLSMNGGGELSADFSLRKLYNSAGDETIDWNSMRLTGSLWTVDGDLSVTGTLRADLDFTGNTLAGVTTDDISEGSNKYYTDERVDDRVGSILTPSYPITVNYDDSAGTVGIGFDGIKGQILNNKTIHVSPSGTDDRTSSVSNYDIADPFLSIRQAQDQAVAGDTIMVWPGSYANESGLFKDNVSFYFHPGAVVSNVGATQSESMFVDCEAMTCSVYGYGKFTTSEENYPLLVVGHPGSVIHFECERIESTFTGKPAVHCVTGNLRTNVKKILSAGDGVRIAAGTVIVENSYIQSSGNGNGVNVTGGAPVAGVFINGCQILSEDTSTATGAVYVETGSSTTRIKNTLLKTGSDTSVTTSASSTAQISLLGGVCGNKDVHASVSTIDLAPFTFDQDLELTII